MPPESIDMRSAAWRMPTVSCVQRRGRAECEAKKKNPAFIRLFIWVTAAATAWWCNIIWHLKPRNQSPRTSRRTGEVSNVRGFLFYVTQLSQCDHFWNLPFPSVPQDLNISNMYASLCPVLCWLNLRHILIDSPLKASLSRVIYNHCVHMVLRALQ